MLSPETVPALHRLATGPRADALTFLDLLLGVVSVPDCEPILPVDFEQLNQLGLRLACEPSQFLTKLELWGDVLHLGADEGSGRHGIAAAGLPCEALPDGMTAKIDEHTAYEPRCRRPLRPGTDRRRRDRAGAADRGGGPVAEHGKPGTPAPGSPTTSACRASTTI